VAGRDTEPRGVHRGGRSWERIHHAIADAALVELAAHGYADMAMDAAAAPAGVSERTVYRHFSTKLELALAAIDVLPTYDGWTDGDDDTFDRVKRAVGIGAAHRDLLVPVLATSLVHRNSVPELLHALREHVLKPRRSVIARLIEVGQERGEIHPHVDPEAVAALTTGLLVDHCAGMVDLGEGEVRIHRVVEAVWPLVATGRTAA